MAATENKKSFWEIFAIVVGAIAAVLGGLSGVAALITVLKDPPKPEAAPTAQAASARTPPTAIDDAAQRAAELERKLAEVVSAKKKAEEEAKAAKAELARVKTATAEEKQVKAQEAEPQQRSNKIDDFIGMKLVYVPGGCFMMGSLADDKDHQDDESPVHEVCVDGFYMGKYEVTQGQWEKVMGANPSKFNKGGNYPVEQVSWNDAQDFIKKLNRRTGKEYRLPTEAEWEYACRANGSSKYCGGDDVDAVAWHDKNSGGGTHPVGGKQANGFSLYDMSGNVWEWCADWYDGGYYASSPQSNPIGLESSSERMIRGGSWGNASKSVRTVNRGGRTPDWRDGKLGFRLVLPVR